MSITKRWVKAGRVDERKLEKAVGWRWEDCEPEWWKWLAGSL